MLRGDLLGLNQSVIFWRFFFILNQFERFRSMKNGKFQRPKTKNRRLVPRFHLRVLYHVKERYLFI